MPPASGFSPLSTAQELELARAAATDAAAARALFERYFDPVYRYWALRTGSAVAAERAAIATLEAALRRLGEFPSTGLHLVAWLLHIARQSADRSDASGAPGVSEPGAFQRGAAERAAALLGRADHRTAAALILKFAAGFSVSEVARETGSTQERTRAALYRAIGKVRRAMECGE